MDPNLEASYYRSSIRALWGTKTDTSPFGGYPPRKRLADPGGSGRSVGSDSTFTSTGGTQGLRPRASRIPHLTPTTSAPSSRPPSRQKHNLGHAGSHPDAADVPVKNHSGRSGGKCDSSVKHLDGTQIVPTSIPTMRSRLFLEHGYGSQRRP